MTQITEEQKKELIKLWFIYGNKGKKHTHHNHRFIQNFIEQGEDTEEFYRKADKTITIRAGIDWNTIKLTDECVDAVRAILNTSENKNRHE